jgi:hypothetical protein
MTVYTGIVVKVRDRNKSWKKETTAAGTASSRRTSVLAAYRGCILVVVGGDDFCGLGRLQNTNAAIVQPQDEAANGVVPRKEACGRVELETARL